MTVKLREASEDIQKRFVDEFHVEENKPLGLNDGLDLSVNSHRVLHFKCKKHDKQYQMRVIDWQSGGTKCQFCKAARSGSTMILNASSEIKDRFHSEFDPEKNLEVYQLSKEEAMELTIGSHYVLHWRCKHGRDYMMRVVNWIKKGTGCSICRAERDGKTLLNSIPNFHEEFDIERNIKMTKEEAGELTIGSTHTLSWKCKPHGVSFEMKIQGWKNGGTKCLLCRANKLGIILLKDVISQEDLSRFHREFHPEKNEMSKDEVLMLSQRSKIQVWWHCHQHNTTYQKSICNWLEGNRNCALCQKGSTPPRPQQSKPPTLVIANAPDEVRRRFKSDFDPDRNDLSVDEAMKTYSVSSKRQVYWNCFLHHKKSYRQKICSWVVHEKSGCPACKAVTDGKMLLGYMSEGVTTRLQEEFDITRNNLTLEEAMDLNCVSRKILDWKCCAHENHYKMAVRTWSSGSSGCFQCRKEKEFQENLETFRTILRSLLSHQVCTDDSLHVIIVYKIMEESGLFKKFSIGLPLLMAIWSMEKQDIQDFLLGKTGEKLVRQLQSEWKSLAQENLSNSVKNSIYLHSIVGDFYVAPKNTNFSCSLDDIVSQNARVLQVIKDYVNHDGAGPKKIQNLVFTKLGNLLWNKIIIGQKEIVDDIRDLMTEDDDELVSYLKEDFLKEYEKVENFIRNQKFGKPNWIQGLTAVRLQDTYQFGCIDRLNTTDDIVLSTLLTIETLDSEKTIIVCPHSRISDWVNECNKYFFFVNRESCGYRIIINNHREILISSYDDLDSSLFSTINGKVGMVVIDQIHNEKNAFNVASQFVNHIRKRHRFKVLVTGKPVFNHVDEARALISMISDKTEFKYTFCDPNPIGVRLEIFDHLYGNTLALEDFSFCIPKNILDFHHDIEATSFYHDFLFRNEATKITTFQSALARTNAKLDRIRSICHQARKKGEKSIVYTTSVDDGQGGVLESIITKSLKQSGLTVGTYTGNTNRQEERIAFVNGTIDVLVTSQAVCCLDGNIPFRMRMIINLLPMNFNEWSELMNWVSLRDAKIDVLMTKFIYNSDQYTSEDFLDWKKIEQKIGLSDALFNGHLEVDTQENRINFLRDVKDNYLRQEKTNKKRKVDDTDLLLSPQRTQNEEIHKKDDARLPFLKTILDDYRTDFPHKKSFDWEYIFRKFNLHEQYRNTMTKDQLRIFYSNNRYILKLGGYNKKQKTRDEIKK